ncbi:IS1595 family transposase [Halobacteriales archaeon QS_8_69_26]|nr:MAG: IS1595 family transposase [Halobacteriales archaeon QS_8_69_26]
MSTGRPALGEMLADLVELGAIEFRPEPLDALVERRLKAVWTARSCPNCGAESLQALSNSSRIWCGRCDWKTTYTRGTPFYNSDLAPGEVLIAFVLYADSLLSINQIALLLSPCYKTLFERIKETETAFHRGFPTVWGHLPQTVKGPTQIDETQQQCSGYKGQEPPRNGLDRAGSSSEAGRTRWSGEWGDELTLVAACRDSLRVVAAEEGVAYDEELGPVLEEVEDLSQSLGEVWTDEFPAYKAMDHDRRIVVHDEEYVTDDGVHTNQVECLWSLIQPWLAKFRGLSKQGLEQAARTYGFVRSLNLTDAPLRNLVSCIAVNAFR